MFKYLFKTVMTHIVRFAARSAPPGPAPRSDPQCASAQRFELQNAHLRSPDGLRSSFLTILEISSMMTNFVSRQLRVKCSPGHAPLHAASYDDSPGNSWSSRRLTREIWRKSRTTIVKTHIFMSLCRCQTTLRRYYSSSLHYTVACSASHWCSTMCVSTAI